MSCTSYFEAAQLNEVRQTLQEANAALEAYQQREAVFQSENQLRVKAQETVKQLQARVAQLEKDVAQRDEALVDMAQELGKSKLRVSTLAQFKATAQQEAWVDDTTVDNCQLCNSAFNLVNRKVRHLPEAEFGCQARRLHRALVHRHLAL